MVRFLPSTPSKPIDTAPLDLCSCGKIFTKSSHLSTASSLSIGSISLTVSDPGLHQSMKYGVNVVILPSEKTAPPLNNLVNNLSETVEGARTRLLCTEMVCHCVSGLYTFLMRGFRLPRTRKSMRGTCHYDGGRPQRCQELEAYIGEISSGNAFNTSTMSIKTTPAFSSSGTFPNPDQGTARNELAELGNFATPLPTPSAFKDLLLTLSPGCPYTRRDAYQAIHGFWVLNLFGCQGLREIHDVPAMAGRSFLDLTTSDVIPRSIPLGGLPQSLSPLSDAIAYSARVSSAGWMRGNDLRRLCPTR